MKDLPPVRCLVVALTVLVAMGICSGSARAVVGCEDDGLILSGRMITDICWDCMFPLRVGGTVLSGGTGDVPAGATNQAVCICQQNGLPSPGFTVGFWMPFQIIELVRQPGCMVSLGGLSLSAVDPLQQGTKGFGTADASDAAFMHVHTYAFPVLQMLDLFFNASCFTGVLSDMDVLFMSELDPTWTYDYLAFFAAPESAVAALPPAQLACLADAGTAMAGQSIDDLYWCAGSWGALYPLSGNGAGPLSPVAYSSLLATKELVLEHRRGLAVRSMGDDALCEGVYEPLMPKSQYRMSLLFPKPEAHGKHVIGQTPLIWGDWRTIPATGEDITYLIWRWQDCCLPVL